MESVSLMIEPDFGGSKKSSIEDDFTYGVTVAQTNIKLRLAFLRKVYGILSAQLGLTILVSAVFMNTPWIKGFVQQRPELLLIAFLLSMGFLIALMFKRRESPTNFYLLFAFTLVEAYTLGTLVTFYDKMIVLEAFGMTAATTIALTMYTFQSKRDYSSWGAGLFTILWIFIVAGFMQFFFQSELLELAYGVTGALLFSAFIVFDTHMLMHKMSAEEYIMASINLYLDIINLFIHILKILDSLKRN
ncbi:protein lifeguard 4 [Exaiptasia diaphana]|uniref:Transmembrane BAX inhibitor motif-containing protein 4 n=1 Tax=Exaiptasia diaphana TaxID=2652724 RepID=A0A913X3I2_EXADI|nr:protein lifeguard 4 [Exaiptasia diaphana]KXJ15631.1 Protein lifeguard 4 [Exaiptasia diaphana]